MDKPKDSLAVEYAKYIGTTLQVNRALKYDLAQVQRVLHELQYKFSALEQEKILLQEENNTLRNTVCERYSLDVTEVLLELFRSNKRAQQSEATARYLLIKDGYGDTPPQITT